MSYSCGIHGWAHGYEPCPNCYTNFKSIECLLIAEKALKEIESKAGHRVPCTGKSLNFCDAGCEYALDAKEALDKIEEIKNK